MFIPNALVSRSSGPTMPQACTPFSIHSNICVGDLIAIIACGIAGIGFFCWAIHAIRKMGQFPFNFKGEDKEKRDEESERTDHYHVPSASDDLPLVQRGVVQTPSIPKRVRTRMALSVSEEDFYRSSTHIPSSPYSAPRFPPPAGRQSLSRSGRHGLPMRGGAGERYEQWANGGYIRDASPSHARGSSLHRSGSGYGPANPAMYAY